MRDADRCLAEELARRVRQKFHEAQIWVFGSRARGDVSPESDMDVCVVLKACDDATESEIRSMAWEIGFDQGMVITVMCYGEDEFFRSPRRATFLARNVLTEGVAV